MVSCGTDRRVSFRSAAALDQSPSHSFFSKDEDPLTSLAISPTGESFVVGDQKGWIKVCHLPCALFGPDHSWHAMVVALPCKTACFYPSSLESLELVHTIKR